MPGFFPDGGPEPSLGLPGTFGTKIRAGTGTRVPTMHDVLVYGRGLYCSSELLVVVPRIETVLMCFDALNPAFHRSAAATVFFLVPLTTRRDASIFPVGYLYVKEADSKLACLAVKTFRLFVVCEPG